MIRTILVPTDGSSHAEKAVSLAGELARALDAKVVLIVMGCRGLSSLEGLMFGSVSHTVNHLASCNCLIVR